MWRCVTVSENIADPESRAVPDTEETWRLSHSGEKRYTFLEQTRQTARLPTQLSQWGEGPPSGRDVPKWGDLANPEKHLLHTASGVLYH